MKIVTIIGARPQFIKASAVSRRIRHQHQEVLVHTGQHYDENMSSIFFSELDIPDPEYHLGVGSGAHGHQTGLMLSRIEEVLLKEQPTWVLVYGDTNSTLAGALAAVKLHIKVAHVEAGLRSFNRSMPEEINRVLTDHSSDMLFCPTDHAVRNLVLEGIEKRAHLVGDVMHQALTESAKRAYAISTIIPRFKLSAGGYILATVHRAENTDNRARLHEILSALRILAERTTVVFPAHPRTRAVINRESLNIGNVTLIDPVGYLDMVMLEQSAKAILTDSGGVQREARWLNVPCITLRDETEWPETIESGWNQLVGANQGKILSAYDKLPVPVGGSTTYSFPDPAGSCLNAMERES